MVGGAAGRCRHSRAVAGLASIPRSQPQRIHRSSRSRQRRSSSKPGASRSGPGCPPSPSPEAGRLRSTPMTSMTTCWHSTQRPAPMSGKQNSVRHTMTRLPTDRARHLQSRVTSWSRSDPVVASRLCRRRRETRVGGRRGCRIQKPLRHARGLQHLAGRSRHPDRSADGATDGERLVAFDAATGKPVWSAKGVERSINTNPSVLGIDLGCAAPLPLCESAGEVWYRRCESQGRFDRVVSRR